MVKKINVFFNSTIVLVMMILHVCYYYHFCVERSKNMAEAKNNYNFRSDPPLLSLSMLETVHRISLYSTNEIKSKLYGRKPRLCESHKSSKLDVNRSIRRDISEMLRDGVVHTERIFSSESC